jgi:hypothetical protein
LEEVEPYQKKAIAKHKRNRLTTKGKVKKSPPFSVNPPKERGKSAPPIGEEKEDEIEEKNIAELDTSEKTTLARIKQNRDRVKAEKEKEKKEKDLENAEAVKRWKRKQREKDHASWVSRIKQKEKEEKEEKEDEIEEISSMAGGSVEGYAAPLGAQPKRKKKKFPPYMEPHMHQDEAKDPKKGTGKKPKGTGRRLYTDEDPSDTVSVKFSTVQDIKDTLSKASFKSKSHKRQSQIINLIHQRARAAYNNAKDPKVKSRLKKAYNYAKTRKEASKRKTQRMNKSK